MEQVKTTRLKQPGTPFQTDGNLSVPENNWAVFEFNTDADNDSLTYKIEYGDDSQFFEINATSESYGLTPRDYENTETIIRTTFMN